MSKYNAVIQRLLDQARSLGYEIISVVDEEGAMSIPSDYNDDQVVRLATDVDMCKMVFRNPKIELGVFGRNLCFHIVLGNDLDETICDFTDHGIAERIASDSECHFSRYRGINA